MDGWLDRKKIDGWLVGWIEKNRWIKNGRLDGCKKWMVGWITHGWLKRKKED